MQDRQSLIERRRAVVANGIGQFAGGIGVMNVGPCEERVVAAIQAQAARLLHACIHVASHEP